VIELEEAQKFVLERVAPMAPVIIDVARARGCVLAAEVVAREAVPGFVNSSMDGFAMRASDTSPQGARLRVVDQVYAGDVSSIELAPGQAVRIMTGAPLPAGADCVCMIEEAVLDAQTVTVSRQFSPGDYVRQVGEDTRPGQVLLSPGDVLDAARIGVLAGQGVTQVLAHRRPRVGVLSTGNELVDDNSPLGPGAIRDLNRPLLLALLEESGFEPVDLGTARDTREAITSSLSRGVRECDAVVSTGGVSVGDVDFVKVVLGELPESEARWMQVAIKPAKPFAFAVVGPQRTPVFGLPGNPVSTKVSFEMFVRPALRVLAGHRILERPSTMAVLDEPLDRRADGKVHLVHVTVAWGEAGRLRVTDVMRHGSHLLNAVAGANAIAVVREGAPSRAGDAVRVIILDAESLGGAS
jgi:molybdenum cofactor synthesis domain-containing protein